MKTMYNALSDDAYKVYLRLLARPSCPPNALPRFTVMRGRAVAAKHARLVARVAS